MEFEDPDEQEEEMGYDALGNSLRGVKVGGSGGGGGETTASTAVASRKSGSRYRECLKNHAVSIGGNAVDGCGEFMPAGEEGTMDALKCAACNCHRNFHRKETEGAESFHHHFSPYYRNFPAGYLHLAAHHRPPPLALPSTSGGAGGAHSGGEQDDVSNPSAGGVATPGSGTGGKKRFRTKFTQEQKDKMLAFAESLGWRIQKHDEVAVQQFCADTCIKRHVLKVWMHNNKHTLGKKL